MRKNGKRKMVWERFSSRTARILHETGGAEKSLHLSRGHIFIVEKKKRQGRQEKKRKQGNHATRSPDDAAVRGLPKTLWKWGKVKMTEWTSGAEA